MVNKFKITNFSLYSQVAGHKLNNSCIEFVQIQKKARLF